MTIQLYRLWVYSKDDKDIGFRQMNIWSLWKIATDHTGKLHAFLQVSLSLATNMAKEVPESHTFRAHYMSVADMLKTAESGELRCT